MVLLWEHIIPTSPLQVPGPKSEWFPKAPLMEPRSRECSLAAARSLFFTEAVLTSQGSSGLLTHLLALSCVGDKRGALRKSQNSLDFRFLPPAGMSYVPWPALQPCRVKSKCGSQIPSSCFQFPLNVFGHSYCLV